MYHVGYFQMHMSIHFPKTPLCNWVRWRVSACRNNLELESQCLAVISWLGNLNGDLGSVDRKLHLICLCLCCDGSNTPSYSMCLLSLVF